MHRPQILILLCGVFLSGCFFNSNDVDELSYSGPIEQPKNSISSDQGGSLILQVQKVLKEKGYNPGPIDGLIGSKTRAAIKQYQAAENIRVSGNPDSNTLIALGLRQGEVVRQPPKVDPPKNEVALESLSKVESFENFDQEPETDPPASSPGQTEMGGGGELISKVKTESLPEKEILENTTIEIIPEIFKQEPGFVDISADIEMVLIDQRGREHKQRIHHKVLESSDGGKDVYYRISSPANIQGTALLSRVDARGEIKEQLLYLPALKKVKKIKGSSRFRSFVGSQFTYEDLGGGNTCVYQHQYVRDESYNGRDCMVIESVPVDSRRSGYSRKLSWVDKEYQIARLVEYYDRRDKLYKTAITGDIKQHSDQIWRPGELLIKNEKNGKATRMILQNYSFATGISEEDLILE